MTALFSLALLALGYSAYQGLLWLAQANYWTHAPVFGWVAASVTLF